MAQTLTATTDEKSTTRALPEVASDVAMQSAISRPPAEDTKIVGRWGKFDSGFWKVAIPMLSVRYFGRYASSLLGLEKHANPIISTLYGTVVGTVMAGVTGLYARRTYNDMKTLFGEAVGWELSKPADDVTFKDMWNSKNAIVQTTMRNYAKYNVKRLAFTSLPFFNFLIPPVGTTIKNNVTSAGKPEGKLNGKFDIYGSVDLGVGATGAYLVSDVITRKVSFFEKLQDFTDRKVNHAEGVGEVITANDLNNLYALHAKAVNSKDKHPEVGTPAWEENQKLFTRMASLMNETYGNAANQEGANFTIQKMIYLLGNDLIKSDDPEKNQFYVEIANRYGMDAVKDVATALAKSIPLEEISKKYPVNTPLESAEPASEKLGKTFAHEGLKNNNFMTAFNQKESKSSFQEMVSANQTSASHSIR